MIQCKDCEYCDTDSEGKRIFRCDPFANVKEPECVLKWQLIRLDMLLTSYQGMLKFQQKMAPLQDKILKYVRREIEDIDESDRWKVESEDENEKIP
ncbi:MAG: hypothetical protein ACYSSI_05750 [Planctomycetota bacterium]|jgi:hypothetical protein